MPFGHLGGLNFANLVTCGHSYIILTIFIREAFIFIAYVMFFVTKLYICIAVVKLCVVKFGHIAGNSYFGVSKE